VISGSVVAAREQGMGDDVPLQASVTRPGHVQAVTFPELFQLPTVVDLTTAGRALGIGVKTAYKIVRNDRFPCRVFRLGYRYQVPTAALMKALGVESMPVFMHDVYEGGNFAGRFG
jgi:hypothetical protein